MTNYEKFKDVIGNIVSFAVKNGVATKCEDIHCVDCDFDLMRDCSLQRLQWCVQEYKESGKPEKPEKSTEKVKDSPKSSSFTTLLFRLLILAAELEILNRMVDDDALTN